jgi:hypothetical protein
MDNNETIQRLSRGMPLIFWEEHSQKWCNGGNDYFCYPAHDKENTWVVSARYKFAEDIGLRQLVFPTEHEAMQFFVNFLHKRATRYGE